MGFVLASVAENLHGAGAVPADLLVDGQALGHLFRPDSGTSQGDAKGHAILDGLSATLALVCRECPKRQRSGCAPETGG